ncbi:MAG: chromate resistance protein ChrB domain-containing protein [Candidatus Eiseniibacteriota bacterium]
MGNQSRRDAKGADYTHQASSEGEVCSFATLMREFGLRGKDAALDEVARIVNHADVRPETTAWTGAPPTAT